MKREINIIDLLAEFLQHWRGIVLGMLVGAVLLGTFSYMDSYQVYQGSADLLGLGYEETGDYLRSKLSEGQISMVEEAVRFGQIYRTAKSYMDDSILMQLDFSQVEKTEMIFYVTCNDSQTGYDIEKVYEELVQSDEANQYILTRTGGEVVDIGGIISLGREASEISNDTNSFTVTIVHYSAEDCMKIAQAIAEFVEEKHNELEKTLGEHDITLINQYSASTVDPEIINLQIARRNQINEWNGIAAQFRANLLQVEEKDYYNYLLKNADNYRVNVENPTVSKVQVVLGMSIGAFVYILILLGRYLLNTRLCVTDQLQELYDIPQFGVIVAPEKKKRIFNFIDQRIRQLRDRRHRQYTVQQALELVTVAVKVAAEQEKLQELYFVSCGLSENSLTVCEKIKEALEREKIQVKIVNHVLTDVQAMNELESGKTAVLAEEAAAAFYSEISSEIDMLEKKNIKVLGGIVLE